MKQAFHFLNAVDTILLKNLLNDSRRQKPTRSSDRSIMRSSAQGVRSNAEIKVRRKETRSKDNFS